jgi:hypothetical protein
VQDALLDALVEDGDGGAVDVDEGLLVAGGEGLAHETEGSAELGLVGAVDGRLGYGLTGALEGGDVVCHGARLFSFPVGERGCWRRLVLNLSAVQRFLCTFDFMGFVGVGQCGESLFARDWYIDPVA